MKEEARGDKRNKYHLTGDREKTSAANVVILRGTAEGPSAAKERAIDYEKGVTGGKKVRDEAMGEVRNTQCQKY